MLARQQIALCNYVVIIWIGGVVDMHLVATVPIISHYDRNFGYSVTHPDVCEYVYVCLFRYMSYNANQWNSEQ